MLSFSPSQHSWLELKCSAVQIVHSTTFTFTLIWFWFFFLLVSWFFYSFSSVSAITSISYLLLPVLFLLFTHFSFLISPSFLVVTGGGGHRCQRSFPDLLILSFLISSSPTSHAHTHTRICFNLSLQPSHPPVPSLHPPVRPWHKCICSIPPANRLVGCYQRQEEGDNGFHHIFSLPQIKMGQVTQHTQTHTPEFTVTHTHTHTHRSLYMYITSRM